MEPIHYYKNCGQILGAHHVMDSLDINHRVYFPHERQ